MQTIIKARGLVDVNAEIVRANQYVAIKGKTIVAVGAIADMPAVPSDTKVLDCCDKYILPGLVNSHVHVGTLYSASNPEFEDFGNFPNELLAVAGARHVSTELMSGVTTLRDCAGHNRVVFALRRAIEMEIVPGPRIISSGRCLTITGGHCHFIGVQVDGPNDVTRAVRQQLQRGADFIKIMATGGDTRGTDPGYASFSVNEIHAACETAHRIDKKISAHCRGIPGIENAIKAGVDQIEHADFELPDGTLQFDSVLADQIAARGIYVTPTIQLYRDLIAISQHKRAEGKLSVSEDRQLSLLQRALDEKYRTLEGFLQAGVQCVAGNDAGLPATPFGSFWRELDAMVTGGMTPMQAIVAATRTGAEAIGLYFNIGSIEAGKQADIIAVDHDPTVDIKALKRISLVMQAGKVCS